MVNKFGVSSSRILFKIAVAKLLDEYPKMKNTLIPLSFFVGKRGHNPRSM